jgi:hypothetical protein
LAVVVLALIGVGTAMYMWNKAPETVDRKAGIEISAQALAQAYGNNEQHANDTYLNKVIEVSGEVAETETNQDGGLMAILDTGDPMTGIQCAMREKGVVIKTGEHITVKGFCSGSGITGVSLTDCIIIRK